MATVTARRTPLGRAETFKLTTLTLKTCTFHSPRLSMLYKQRAATGEGKCKRGGEASVGMAAPRWMA